MMLRKLNAYKHRTDHQHSTLIDARQLQALTKDSRLTRAEIPKTPTWACPSEFGDIAMCPRRRRHRQLSQSESTCSYFSHVQKDT
eukprot:scaffold1729_cov76-Skeletonema_dohrnii-CCMP3373.AAC.1